MFLTSLNFWLHVFVSVLLHTLNISSLRLSWSTIPYNSLWYIELKVFYRVELQTANSWSYNILHMITAGVSCLELHHKGRGAGGHFCEARSERLSAMQVHWHGPWRVWKNPGLLFGVARCVCLVSMFVPLRTLWNVLKYFGFASWTHEVCTLLELWHVSDILCAVLYR